MADSSKKTTLRDRWDGLVAEFHKIVWPDGQMISKQSIATIVVSVFVALIIVFFDMVIQYGVDFLVGL